MNDPVRMILSVLLLTHSDTLTTTQHEHMEATSEK